MADEKIIVKGVNMRSVVKRRLSGRRVWVSKFLPLIAEAKIHKKWAMTKNDHQKILRIAWKFFLEKKMAEFRQKFSSPFGSSGSASDVKSK